LISLSYFCGAVETSLTVTSKTKAHACSNVNKGPKTKEHIVW